jgi:hypothetical protein
VHNSWGQPFFCLWLRVILGFFTLDFLGIIPWNQGCSSLSIIKKVVGTCGVSRWPLLAFHSSVRSITPPFMSQRMLASIARKSSNDNFSTPFFSLFHLKRCIGLANLQNVPQSFNCIEFDLFVFSISSLTLDFLRFFNQIWSLFFWFLFILFLIFFYWILFFYLSLNILF